MLDILSFRKFGRKNPPKHGGMHPRKRLASLVGREVIEPEIVDLAGGDPPCCAVVQSIGSPSFFFNEHIFGHKV